jgi:hypothetical protein
MKRILVVAALVGVAAVVLPSAQAPAAGAATHARSVKRLLITNAMVIYGSGKPAFGPVDVLIEGGLIARVGTVPRTGPTRFRWTPSSTARAST